MRQLNAEYEVSKSVNKALENLSAIKLTDKEIDLNLVTQSVDILKICDATAAVIIFNNQLYKVGNLPADHDLLLIADTIAKHTNNTYYTTEQLICLIPNLTSLCNSIAGVIYHELSSTGNNCIMWFRGESISEVHWAGDPSKAILKDKNGLSPRNSFKLYKEIVQCVSKPWLQPELNAAANFAHILQKHGNFLVLSAEEAKYRQLSEILKETNLELENINWISTHDLQEPLRKMQLASSKILLKEQSNLSTEVIHSLTRINKSASRMQNLLVDILKYTRITQEEVITKSVDLNHIIQEILDNMQTEISQSNVKILLDDLPSVKGSAKLLSQVFSNLITNAITFTSKNSSPKIEILSKRISLDQNSAIPHGEFYQISVSDNGIGFDNQFATTIFNVFTKVHNQDEFASSGSGIGLAVVKKIMNFHGGFVSAESDIGGSKFHVYFPIQ